MTKEKIKVNMLSSSETVPGQGVSGAYRELMRLLKRDAREAIDLTENKRIKADITHYHTIDIPFYLSTFRKNVSGVGLAMCTFCQTPCKEAFVFLGLYSPLWQST